jgi:hypothetical protein
LLVFSHSLLSHAKQLVFNPSAESPQQLAQIPYEYQICGADANLFQLDRLSVTGTSNNDQGWSARLINWIASGTVSTSSRPPITIEVAGRLLDDLMPGTSLEVVLKYRLIRLLRRTLNVCDELDRMNDGQGDEDVGKCPISKGDKLVRKTFELSNDIPAGDYTANVLMRSHSGQQVFCATIKFTL